MFPFDFTIGLGTKRLKGLKIPFTDKVGLFGGVELSLNPRINLMAEYNPIDYEKDKRSARGVPEGAKYPVDIGMRAKILPGINMGLSYQRGDTLGIMLHVQTELGKPILPQRANPPPQVEVDKRPFEKRDLRKMVKEIYRAIHDEGFSDVSVYTDGENLIAEFSNTRYLSYQKAAGRVLRILLLHAPSDAKKLTAIVKQKALPILPDPTKLKAFFSGDRGFSYRPGIKPEFQTYLNDPSGFFKFRVGMKPYAVADLWKGAQGYARYDIPFYSNIRSSNVPVPGAVASDSWKYMGRSFSFDRLMIDQTLRLSKRVFGRLSFGYFESMFAGAGGEVLGFFGDGNIALGLESDLVRKREPKTQFNLTDLRAHTLLASGYYRSPGLGTTLEVQYGRFLAGDVGWLLTLSREYDTGVIIGAWYSKTSTENLTEYNRGYNDKGVFLSLPARIFLTHDSTERYYYALRPWTRDVAAKVYHWQSLFDMASDLMPAVFRSRISDLKR
ncbi:MAG: YjbH domain-containing protein [Deltaproteobacteria bacterium]|nr:YjbH domain-containing protein [Deltaproteobacteria bacterium]